jgi:CRISPR-associated protein Csd1
MILQALKEYYDRKSDDPNSGMAPPGFEWKEIPFIVVLNKNGEPVSIEETYEGEEKNRRAKRFLVPQGVKRANNIEANLFWDNPEYVLGISLKGKPERVIKQHASFIKRIDDLGLIPDDGLKAIKDFLSKENKLEQLQAFPAWPDLLKDRGNLTFRLIEDEGLILARPGIKKAIIGALEKSDGSEKSICLVTGNQDVIERLHSAIKGVYGAQSSGANIVSINNKVTNGINGGNTPSFASFGKQQGANSPVGKKAAFAYTTALNHLLSKGSRQRMQVGDASTVFWAEKATDFETQFADFFGESPKDDPDRGTQAVEALFKAVDAGAFSEKNRTANNFYVLGLSPNASRIAVRFWIVDTVAGMAGKIRQHFEDIRVIHGPKEKDFLSLFRLLISTAAQGKAENIPPNLAGDTIRCVLQGLPYPRTLLQAVIRRLRAEHTVNHARAALIKACINRSTRLRNPNVQEELTMSLDENNMNVGYRLGRLFATLEKIQQEANPGINATIRDKFYGAASGTPVTVFGNLMRLKNHHLSKLENPGRRIFFERLLGQILEGVDATPAFPTHLGLDDQGRFAIGYYHQMQAFYAKKINDNELTKKEEENE